jgi:hypothetical protein|tara:strand:- start:1043 stop:1255 length:213 start_codon:yes stop_codon:yes gene_type:complete
MTYQEKLARAYFGDYVTLDKQGKVIKTVTPRSASFAPYTAPMGYFTDCGELVDSTGDTDRLTGLTTKGKL